MLFGYWRKINKGYNYILVSYNFSGGNKQSFRNSFTLCKGKDAEAEYYFDSTLEDFAIKIINDTIHCQILPLKNADSYSGIISFINKTTIQTPFGTFKKLEQDEVNKEFTFNSHHQSE